MKKNNQDSKDKNNKKGANSEILESIDPFTLNEGQTFISLQTLEELEKEEKQKKSKR